MTKNIHFSGNKKNPFHLSVGAVLWVDNQITLIQKSNGKITLPRETIYSEESIEAAIARGLAEEIGATNVKIKRFVGSLQTYFSREDGTIVAKTTIYFEVASTEPSFEIRNPKEDEIHDQVLWLNPSVAIDALKETENDEYKIIQNIIGEQQKKLI